MIRENSLKALLIEDNPGDARLIRYYLEENSLLEDTEELELTHVENLTKGLEHLDENAYDFVLLDLGLPESTGLETLDRVLSHSPELPVIVLTGLDDREVAGEAIMWGAQDYLPKDDLNSTQLMRSLQYAIERKKREEQLAALNRINALIRDINKALLTATTRAEIEQAACERFIATEPYTFAMVGEFSSDFEQFLGRYWESVDKRGLESVMVSENRVLGHQPAAKAVQTQEVQVVENIPEEVSAETEEDETAEHEFESVAAIPIVFESVHGVLVVYADRPYAFDEQEREVLGELGRTIGYAITTLEAQGEQVEPDADSSHDPIENEYEDQG
ncbi:response regulator [Haloferax mediterranei ATCC 33500]|uniref:DNA-binding protein n=1 Tax=Haloferax mediterranei (strain ATCC 33500 / DSM 1411 / JCM 8866 / NBRC 14739 / NCIMB 2177 / R-4) TaxID=523841 RepID=I3R8U3_HALMT|nr:response regulator [Haloferax mediterranei]AFK20653.1 response regulator with CheY-like receiver, AAA-type ATPase, and DNA-binding domains [Haloferax mediterranei ATCC 33500]AHZ22862.1 DNA-binding protein [Haloferax mediterranei ATCC 33500]EMA03027.1 response regulator with CheY-like receiver, AAA-type ATPase, and DNA-binding domains [Haloferax mediterranei ATCC 33500]MDX5987792.1 response regulator [Haloferax mediterranei ATCC 33500]QCQ74270.1 response regulator [Haloferax mediterranei ATC